MKKIPDKHPTSKRSAKSAEMSFARQKFITAWIQWLREDKPNTADILLEADATRAVQLQVAGLPSNLQSAAG